MNPPPMSRWRWLFYAAGSAMIAFGLWGQLFGADTNPRRWAELLVAAALAHDLLVAPVVLLLGLLVRRSVHRHARGALQGGALVVLALVLVALPGVGRFGARTDNASLLPRDYRAGLLLCVGLVAAGVLVVAAVRALRHRG